MGIQAEMNVVSAYRTQGGELVWLWPGCWPICSQGIDRGNRGSERLESAAPPGTRRNGWKPHDGQAEALLDPFGARGFWPRLSSVSRCAAHTIEITIFIVLLYPGLENAEHVLHHTLP